MSKAMEIEQLAEQVKLASEEVYKVLGAGYNETVYEEAMGIELRERKIPYEVERNTEIFYKGEKVGIHRLDFILEDKFVVELKAQLGISRSHVGQTKAYLKTLGLKNGLVVNFPYPDQEKPEFQLIE